MSEIQGDDASRPRTRAVQTDGGVWTLSLDETVIGAIVSFNSRRVDEEGTKPTPRFGVEFIVRFLKDGVGLGGTLATPYLDLDKLNVAHVDEVRHFAENKLRANRAEDPSIRVTSFVEAVCREWHEDAQEDEWKLSEEDYGQLVEVIRVDAFLQEQRKNALSWGDTDEDDVRFEAFQIKRDNHAVAALIGRRRKLGSAGGSYERSYFDEVFVTKENHGLTFPLDSFCGLVFGRFSDPNWDRRTKLGDVVADAVRGITGEGDVVQVVARLFVATVSDFKGLEFQGWPQWRESYTGKQDWCAASISERPRPKKGWSFAFFEHFSDWLNEKEGDDYVNRHNAERLE